VYAQNWDKWRALVNVRMNLRVSYMQNVFIQIEAKKERERETRPAFFALVS